MGSFGSWRQIRPLGSRLDSSKIDKYRDLDDGLPPVLQDETLPDWQPQRAEAKSVRRRRQQSGAAVQVHWLSDVVEGGLCPARLRHEDPDRSAVHFGFSADCDFNREFFIEQPQLKTVDGVERRTPLPG